MAESAIKGAMKYCIYVDSDPDPDNHYTEWSNDIFELARRFPGKEIFKVNFRSQGKFKIEEVLVKVK